MTKQHNLKTLKEIVEVVNEDNLKCFLTDFNNWLIFRIAFKKASEGMSENISMKNEDTFRWIDDGKNNASFTIELKGK